MKKVAGIVQWCYEVNDYTIIYDLIKKGFKFTWNYFKTHREAKVKSGNSFVNKGIIIDDFALQLEKKAHKEKWSEIEAFHNAIILLYLGVKENVTIHLNTPYGEFIKSTIQTEISNYYIRELNFNAEVFEGNREAINQLYKEFGLPLKIKDISFGNFLEEIIQSETKVIAKDSVANLLAMRNKAFKRGISKYIGAYSGWIKVLELNEMDLTEGLIINNTVLDEVFLECLIAMKENEIKEEEKTQFIISVLFIKLLAEEYKKAKSNYFKDKQDEFYRELRELKVDLMNKQVELTNEKKSLEVESKQVISEKEALLNELALLKKENTSLLSQVQQMDKHEKEVFALREFIYQLEEDTDEQIETSVLEEKTEFLKSKKIAIVGGSVTWHKHVKELFPHFIFTNQDSKGRDLSFLNNVDALCVNTATFNHAYYELVMAQMEKNDVPFFYLNKNYNIDRTIEEMNRALKSFN